MTPSAGSSWSTNGCSSSRLAPMPLTSSRGTPPPVPGRTVTRSGWPSTTMLRIAGGPVLAGPVLPGLVLPAPVLPGPVLLSAPRRKLIGIRPLPVQDVQAGRGVQGTELAAAQPAGPVLLPPAARGQPRRIVRPPAARHGLGG